MSTSPEDIRPRAVSVAVTDVELIVELSDGRKLSVPVTWYPRLSHGTPAEKADWRLLGKGLGIHWPRLDEDISVDDLLAGESSGESEASLQTWLASRKG
jgi:hypothetical protein